MYPKRVEACFVLVSCGFYLAFGSMSDNLDTTQGYCKVNFFEIHCLAYFHYVKIQLDSKRKKGINTFTLLAFFVLKVSLGSCVLIYM